MSISIPSDTPPSPDWLSLLLRQSGALQHGSVQAVEAGTSAAFNAHVHYLRLHYSPDAFPTLPAQMVLKQNIADAWAVAAGADEVAFYRLVASLPDHPPIIAPCFAAATDPQTGQSTLLMQDLSDSHAPPITREQQLRIGTNVPAQHAINSCVETLAQLHAFWWDHALRTTETFAVGYWSRTAERFAQYIQRRRSAWEQLMAQEESWFPADLHVLYEQTLAQLTRYWEHSLAPRFAALRDLTLIHGDAYFANFLCPRQDGSGTSYLVDWQSPSFDLGAYDLVNLCATFWTSEQRQAEQRELQALRRYYATLQQHGVRHYTWDDLVQDYQHGLIFWLLMPLQDYADGAGKDYWWPKMRCLVDAFREWHCDALLT